MISQRIGPVTLNPVINSYDVFTTSTLHVTNNLFMLSVLQINILKKIKLSMTTSMYLIFI